MDIFEDAIVPETPKVLPNEQLFVYVPIGTIDYPGIVTFDDIDFRIDEHGRVYMKASSIKNAKDIRDIFALLYGYREGEPAEGKEPGPVMASVKVLVGKMQTVEEQLEGIPKDSKAVKNALDNLNNSMTTALSAVETKLANFLDVSDDKRDQLSEVLSLISANEQAIQQFVSMGGAPVGSGTLVVPAGEWSDGSPTTAYVDLPGNTLRAGSVMLLTPANDATKEAASKARLSVSVDASGDYGDEVNDVLLLLRAETAAKPAIDMEFAYVILQTTATTSLVTLIGVDAAGGTEPTLVDLSRLDPDENGKGYITETYGEGEDATTKEIEVTYDGEGNIVQIGATKINWGGEA